MRKTLLIAIGLCLTFTFSLLSSALVLECAETDAAFLMEETVYASAKEGERHNLGEGEWNIVDDGGTDARVGGGYLVASGYSGVVTLSDGESEKTVHLVGGKKWKPGLNILTGTTEVIDLNHENGAFVVGENPDIRDVANETAAEVNAVAQYRGNYGTHFFPVEEITFDRNILIKFDFSGVSNTTRFLVNGGNEGKFYYDFGSINDKGSWKTYTYDGLASSNATNAYSSINKLGFVICWSGYVEGYFDNYAFIPFYKITYTGIGDEYFLYDQNGNIATEYTVDPSKTLTPEEGFVFDGWSTTENSTEAVDTIELNNEDVVFYPVWRLENAVEYDINIEGMSAIEITADENTYAYTSVISADIPEKGVIWSTDDTSIALIDQNGVLTPLSTGIVTVKAKSNYYPYKSASMQVEVKYPENVEFVTISFEGDVVSLPEDVKLLKGAKLKTDKYMNMVSAVSGKRFNGWCIDGELLWDDPTIIEDTTCTALVNDDYNFAVPSHIGDWKYNVGSVSVVSNAMYCSYVGTHTDAYITNDSLEINIPKYQAIEYYIDVNYKDGGADKKLTSGMELEGTYFARTGEGIAWQRQVKGYVTGFSADGRYAIVRCDMHKNAYWEGTLEHIRFDFIGNSKYDFAVRYIRFVPKDEFENKTVEISRLEEPRSGITPDTEAATASDLYEITDIKWKGDRFLEGGQFDEDIAYTAEITLKSLSNTKCFAKDSTALVNGNEADITVDECGNAVVSYTFEKTEVLIDFSFSIVGEDVVSRNDRSFDYRLEFVSDEPISNKNAVWSVDKPDYAYIDTETGELKAKKNGEIVITAVSSYNPVMSASFNVTISGIDDTPFKITYHSGTQSASLVTNMPEEETTNERIFSFSGKEPEREGYIFLGWSTDENSIETTERLVLSEDVNLYAVWGKGVSYDFNGTDHGVKPAQSQIEAGDTALKVTTDSARLDARLELAGLSIIPSECTTVEVRMAVDTASDIELYFGPDNAGITWQNAQKQPHGLIGLDAYQIYTFDFSNTIGWTGANSISTLWLDPFQSYSTEAHIDYIRALDDNRIIFLNPVGGNIDGDLFVKAKFGQTVSIPQIPQKDGYVFLGWSKEVDKEVISSVFVNDDISLFAVWGEAVEISEDASSASVDSISTEGDSAIVVKTSKNANVIITYTDENGESARDSVKANNNGYAAFDIRNLGVITDVAITSSSKLESVSLTDKNISDSLVAEQISVGGSSSDISSGSSSMEYDMKVEILKNENKAYNTESGTGNVYNMLSSSDEIFFGFDEAFEKGFFDMTQNVFLKGIGSSVITYNILPKGVSGKVDAELSTPECTIDADTHRYIVVRARAFGLDNPVLRISFRKEFEEFSNINSVRNTLSDEYSIYVYDMTKAEKWNGNVCQLKFLLEGNDSGAIDIDWVMITDTIPENTEAYDLASDIFFVTVQDTMSFTDVNKEDWFFNEVGSAYKRGFVNGKSIEFYDPYGNVTIAEVITLATRLNLIYNNKELPKVSDSAEWYTEYINKAIELGIIGEEDYSDYNAAALRKEVAVIMAKALPSEYVNPINTFDDIPDMTSRDKAYRSVLQLYKAGIFTGSDEAYNFLPETGITRAEMAAVVIRLAVPSARKRVYTDAEREANRTTYTAEEILAGVSKSISLDGYTVKDGLASFVSKTKDPTVMFKNLFGTFDGNNINKITIGVKWDTEKAKPSLQLFFLTPGNGWSEDNSVTGTITDTDENGIMNIEFDMSVKKEFRSMIEDLRFDPFDVQGVEFGIAYIIVE